MDKCALFEFIFDGWVNYIVCLCFLNENIVKPVQNDGIFV